MTSVEGMAGDYITQDMLNRSSRSMADEGPLVFCNLPSRKSVSEWEPSRMSYYNGNEHLSVPFKWEAAPGKPIVGETSQLDSRPESPLQLRPPPSASNSPLQPHVPPSYKDLQKSRLPPKFRSYSRPEFTFSISNRSSGSGTMADSNNAGHQRVRSKGSMSRRSEFDWPEVSDDECSTTRTMYEHEPPSSTATTLGSAKNWSFSSSSFRSTSTQSQSPPPVSSVGVARGGGGSARDVFHLRNLVNYAVASSATPTTSAGGSSTEGLEDDEESEESDHHVRPRGGLLSCMPIFSKVRMIQSQIFSGSDSPSAITFSKRLTPGSKNRGYRQSL